MVLLYHILMGHVAPSRERGLKFPGIKEGTDRVCRSFAGAWIEIPAPELKPGAGKVAPSRERGLKFSEAK